MMHAHCCGVCRRIWHHDPNTWPPLAEPADRGARIEQEHTCCGQVWLGRWPAPWPWHMLGARGYGPFARGVRRTVRGLHELGAGLVKLGQRLSQRAPT